MIFIKPEEKRNLHQVFFIFSFLKLHYLEIQMWIPVTEKSLKLCFFLLVVYSFFVFSFFLFFVCTGIRFLNQSVCNHFHTLIHEANWDQPLSQQSMTLYIQKLVHYPLFLFVFVFCIFCFFFFCFLEIWS